MGAPDTYTRNMSESSQLSTACLTLVKSERWSVRQGVKASQLLTPQKSWQTWNGTLLPVLGLHSRLQAPRFATRGSFHRLQRILPQGFWDFISRKGFEQLASGQAMSAVPTRRNLAACQDYGSWVAAQEMSAGVFSGRYRHQRDWGVLKCHVMNALHK